MADAIQVPTTGFAIPNVPGQPAAERAPAPAVPPNPQDAWVSQVPATPPVPAGIDPVQYAAFLAFQKAQGAPAGVAPAVPAPAAPSNPNASLTLPDVPAIADPILKSLTSIFISTGKGLDIGRALSTAVAKGDGDFIDRAYIREKGGESAEHLITLAEGIVSRVSQAAQDASAVAYTAAGGEAQWNAATAAFNASAPTHMKTVVAALMNSGDPESIKAATQTVVEFAQKSGAVAQPGARVTAQHGGVVTGTALSKVDFQTAHAALNANSRTYQQDRATLMERRQLGKLQGL